MFVNMSPPVRRIDRLELSTKSPEVRSLRGILVLKPQPEGTMKRRATRKHFRALASAIHAFPTAEMRHELALSCVEELKRTNHLFNENSFLDAAIYGKIKQNNGGLR